MRGRDVKLSKDGQVFSNEDQSGKVILNFKKEEFVIETAGAKVHTSLSKDMMLRGEFFFVTRSHALWLLRSPVEVPKNFNSEGEEGIHPSTPVLILFENGKERYRLTHKQTEFKHVDRHIGVDDRGPNDHWLDKYDIFIPNVSHKFGTGARAGAFIPQITLFEPKSNFAIKIEIMTGRVMARSTENKEPQIPHPPRHQNSSVMINNKNLSQILAQNQKYAEEMQRVTDEYRSQLRELNARSDKLSDREFNEEVEHITANYNRKMVRLQILFDSVQPKDAGDKKDSSFPRQNRHGLEPDVYARIPVTLDFNPKLTFQLPGCVTIRSQKMLSDEKVELNTPAAFQQPGVQIEVMPTIVIQKLTGTESHRSYEWNNQNQNGFSYTLSEQENPGKSDRITIAFWQTNSNVAPRAERYYFFELNHLPNGCAKEVRDTILESFGLAR